MVIKVNSQRNDIMPRISQFSTPHGTESFLTMELLKGNNITDDIRSLFALYSECMLQYGLSVDTEIYIRFYINDILTEAAPLRQFLNQREVPVFYSLIGQSPASGSRIAMESYHIKSDNAVMKTKISEDELLVYHGGYRSLWLKNLPITAGTSEQQTQEIFNALSYKMKFKGMKLKDDVIRTWCYVNNIDENYAGFVKARREMFSSIGMTEETHTIASTGIGSAFENSSHLVNVDSLAVMGLERSQIEYMTAPDNMPPTHQYGVTFERGTKIRYGDRTHLYISGTASIDTEGEVIYPGNIEKQAVRTMENIQSLLSPHGSDMGDMKMLIIYLREDISYDGIDELLDEVVPDGLPRVIVRGNVCRPSWLIEIEGIAISEADEGTFSPFC